MALPKMKLLIFRISDQNLWNQAKKIQNPSVEFFVNSPEGADHSLKCVKLKIRHHCYFANFWKYSKACCYTVFYSTNFWLYVFLIWSKSTFTTRFYFYSMAFGKLLKKKIEKSPVLTHLWHYADKIFIRFSYTAMKFWLQTVTT